ncbi:MAG TPA: PTS system mannose/fructose/sorbose family transporter subunit IID [Patescibacteria group bacterium]|nr:PTS system mannose/fructose/sorbose family transporter subunit IID [Patescibacteria group bacterium]
MGTEMGGMSPSGGTPERTPVKLDRSDVRRSFWLWTFFSHANYNYERLQGTAFAQAMVPIIKKLYKDPDEIKAALKRHLVFFNTEPNVGGIIHGAVIAMEEQRANGADIDDEAINSVKSGLMGPLAGVGDTISQGTITPILLSVGISLAAGNPSVFGDGNPLGAILYFVAEVGIMLALAYFFWFQGYDRGREGVTALLRSGALDRLVTGAGALGNLVLGALAFQFVHVYVTLTLLVGDGHFELNELLAQIMPGILPLLFTLLTWYLLARRRISPIWLLVAYIVVAMVGAFPIFSGPVDPTTQCPSILHEFYQPDCIPPPPVATPAPA